MIDNEVVHQLWVDNNIILGGWLDAPQRIAKYYPEENYIEFLTSTVNEPMTRLPTKDECLEAIARQGQCAQRNQEWANRVARGFDEMDEEGREADGHDYRHEDRKWQRDQRSIQF